MIRLLPFVLEAILLVFCLIDCILADDTRVRNLPKWGWVLLIVIIPLVGGIAWLVAGRPPRVAPRPTTSAPQWESPPYVRPRAPDDDPEFLAKLKRDNADQERFLKRWEDDLRRREDELRQQDGAGDPTDPNPDDQR
ncbi:MAG: PLD nuclease N-terminal domain-containing protein [Propionicimonas sp.]|uniref:PLD nuclease N-terminal domain-containing protein n=1 Tax=Propionicimonas sp. TaxID=1955623 RepID=UPI003D10DF42